MSLGLQLVAEQRLSTDDLIPYPGRGVYALPCKSRDSGFCVGLV